MILCITAVSKDSPLIIRAGTEKDHNESSFLSLLIEYPIVNSSFRDMISGTDLRGYLLPGWLEDLMLAGLMNLLRQD